MQDETIAMPPLPAKAPSRTGRQLLAAFLAILIVAIGTVVVVWRVPALQHVLDVLLGNRAAVTPARLVQSGASSDARTQPAPPATSSPVAQATDIANQSRMAQLEGRLGRIELEAEAASGNATRAEGLLIAFAARRSIDRGVPLGYLADQIRLRFADAQPNAVQTVIEGATSPVSLDGLYSELDALAPSLSNLPAQESAWSKVRREVAGLFVLRRVKDVTVSPQDRVVRAKLMLAAGKVDEAIAEVEAMPGAGSAQPWIAKARRYQTVQRALDLIETTAMLDPRRLRDDRGTPVEQISPLAEPPAPVVN